MKLNFIFLAILFACASKNDFTQIASDEVRLILQKQSKAIEPSSQLVLAYAPDKNSNQVKILQFTKEKDKWIQAAPEFTGLSGKKNFAAPGTKIEGDLKTPSGVYPLSLVFGYEKSLPIKMPYRQATANSKWVYDIKSSEYNTWVEHETKSFPFEKMLRDDYLYKYGIVIDYNFSPIIPGKGSAIFFHIMEKDSNGTAGCIAAKEILSHSLN